MRPVTLVSYGRILVIGDHKTLHLSLGERHSRRDVREWMLERGTGGERPNNPGGIAWNAMYLRRNKLAQEGS